MISRDILCREVVTAWAYWSFIDMEEKALELFLTLQSVKLKATSQPGSRQVLQAQGWILCDVTGR